MISLFAHLLAVSPWLAPAMFGLGCAMLTMILLRKSWRRIDSAKRLKREDDVRLPQTVMPSATQRDRHEVELHELVRDATARIDTKLALLRELVAQSDRQIARLEELLSNANGEPHLKKGDRGDEGR